MSGRGGHLPRALIAVLCALVVWTYAAIADLGHSEIPATAPAEEYYNLLVDGFRAGHLYLAKPAPPGLAALPDPYDPAANAVFRGEGGGEIISRLGDLSYHRGRLYLYFGITPALLAFWPAVALTGHHLSQAQAAVLFSAIGFLASVGLLVAAWRRHFPAAGLPAVLAGVLALGLAGSQPLVLQRSGVWEVPIACGYALTMLALAALWKSLHEPARRGRWLAAASLLVGLALGARPSLIFGAAALLVPLAQAWREPHPSAPQRRRAVLGLLPAAVLPAAGIAAGLLLYNHLRFGNPLEFGQHFQMAGDRQDNIRHFSIAFFAYNFRAYFLAAAPWRAQFPFLGRIVAPVPPAGHGAVEYPFGILANTPFLLLALALPWIIRGMLAEKRAGLAAFSAAAAFLFATGALALCLFYGTCVRYEMEFAPALALLAAVSLLGIEAQPPAGRPSLRFAVRSLWIAAVAYSVAFSLLFGLLHRAFLRYGEGTMAVGKGDNTEAVRKFTAALRLEPDLPGADFQLGIALLRLGRLEESRIHVEKALRAIVPADIPSCYDWYSGELAKIGRLDEALQVSERGLKLAPESGALLNGRGEILVQMDRTREGFACFEQAVRLAPDYPEAHSNLGLALWLSGQPGWALRELKTAIDLKPSLAQAHLNRATVLDSLGMTPEARDEYAEALRLAPDSEAARRGLEAISARSTQPRR